MAGEKVGRRGADDAAPWIREGGMKTKKRSTSCPRAISRVRGMEGDHTPTMMIFFLARESMAQICLCMGVVSL